jgi:hypothetical protein
MEHFIPFPRRKIFGLAGFPKEMVVVNERVYYARIGKAGQHHRISSAEVPPFTDFH